MLIHTAGLDNKDVAIVPLYNVLPQIKANRKYWFEIIGETCLYKVDGVACYMLWSFFELKGVNLSQRSINALPHILNQFLVGNWLGISWKSQRCMKSPPLSKGMLLAQDTALSPLVDV